MRSLSSERFITSSRTGFDSHYSLLIITIPCSSTPVASLAAAAITSSITPSAECSPSIWFITKALYKVALVHFNERIFLKLKSTGGPFRLYITLDDDYFLIIIGLCYVYKLLFEFYIVNLKCIEINQTINQSIISFSSCFQNKHNFRWYNIKIQLIAQKVYINWGIFDKN